MKIRLYFFLFLILIFSLNLSAKEKILIANIEFAKNVNLLKPAKFEAALDITCKLSEKYELISIKERDSLTKLLQVQGKNPTALDIAKEFNAKYVLFSNINIIGNMLRVDLSTITTDTDYKKAKSYGYSLISKRNIEDDSKIYDPALLAATQRAFAVVMKDSLMFGNFNGVAQVFPAKTLVIGGLFYVNDANEGEWDLFKNKELSSYDACETIFKYSSASKNFVIYDIETRDSIFAMFGLQTPENFNPVSSFELRALSHFQVDSFISGVFKRVADGVEIELILYDIINANLVPTSKSAKGILKEDSILSMRNLIQLLTKEILDIKN